MDKIWNKFEKIYKEIINYLIPLSGYIDATQYCWSTAIMVKSYLELYIAYQKYSRAGNLDKNDI